MVELLKTILAKPLQGVVAVLCVVVVATHLGLADVKTAQAKTEVEQEVNSKVNDLVYNMNDTLIRVDVSLAEIKEDLKQLTDNQREKQYAN